MARRLKIVSGWSKIDYGFSVTNRRWSVCTFSRTGYTARRPLRSELAMDSWLKSFFSMLEYFFRLTMNWCMVFSSRRMWGWCLLVACALTWWAIVEFYLPGRQVYLCGLRGFKNGYVLRSMVSSIIILETWPRRRFSENSVSKVENLYNLVDLHSIYRFEVPLFCPVVENKIPQSSARGYSIYSTIW